MKRILGMGSALVDILIRLSDDSPLEQLALPKGSMQLVDRDRRDAVLEFFSGYEKSLAAGGSAANTVHGIGKLGGSAGFIGMIGEDELGDSFAKDMNSAGVESTLFRSKTPTGCAITLISRLIPRERSQPTWGRRASSLLIAVCSPQSAVRSRQSASFNPMIFFISKVTWSLIERLRNQR